MTASVLCESCQRYFRVPVEEDEDGRYLPPIPPHEPCQISTTKYCDTLESK